MTGPRDIENKMATHLPAADGGNLPDVVSELLRDDVVRAAGYCDDADLAAVLHTVRSMGAGAAPEPSPELAALLAQGLPASLTARRVSRRRKVILSTVICGAMTVSLTGVAAANDKLPAPAQDVVSRVFNDLTPFTIDSGRKGNSLAPKPARARVPRPGLPSPASGQPGPIEPRETARPSEGGEPPESGLAPRPGEAEPTQPANNAEPGDPVSGGGAESEG